MSLPRVVATPEDMADRLGWSIRRVRNVARRAGACQILGGKMVFIPEDIAVMEAIANGELDSPPPAERKKFQSTHVYFFHQTGFIKIGWSKKWQIRLATLQAASPSEITVLAIYRGGIKMERDLHAKFAEHRVRLEWFSDCKAIREYIDANKQKCCKDAKNR